MRKQLWYHLTIAAAVFLAACSQAAPPEPTAAGAVPTPAAPATAAVATRDPNAVEMACTIVSQEPTPGPTEVSMFPPPAEGDWVLGDNPDATMTVIEYSDFM